MPKFDPERYVFLGATISGRQPLLLRKRRLWLRYICNCHWRNIPFPSPSHHFHSVNTFVMETLRPHEQLAISYLLFTQPAHIIVLAQTTSERFATCLNVFLNTIATNFFYKFLPVRLMLDSCEIVYPVTNYSNIPGNLV